MTKTSLLIIFSILVILIITLSLWYINILKERAVEVYETLICVMEAGDPNLDGHSMHVYNIVSVFYDYLPSEYQRKVKLTDLKYAALFHDIGKLGIPRDIITKKGKLTEFK